MDVLLLIFRDEVDMKKEYKTKTRNLIIEYLEKNEDTRFTADISYIHLTF